MEDSRTDPYISCISGHGDGRITFTITGEGAPGNVLNVTCKTDTHAHEFIRRWMLGKLLPYQLDVPPSGYECVWGQPA